MSTHRTSRRGAAAVEFALVAPIFFFAVVMPMIEFGRAMAVSSSLAATSQSACRTGVLPGKTNDDVRAAIANSLSAQGIRDAEPAVIKVNGAQTDVSSAQQGDAISVTVSVRYSNVSWLPPSLSNYLGNVTLSSTQVMRRE